MVDVPLRIFFSRGLVHYTDLLALLRQIDPPLGFGSKCPDLLAYKRLVRMNMPVDEEGKVHFKSTLFALIRINLQIFMRSMEEMDQADQVGSMNIEQFDVLLLFTRFSNWLFLLYKGLHLGKNCLIVIKLVKRKQKKH